MDTTKTVRGTKERCFSCKMITVACLTSIGGYLYFLGRNQQKHSKRIFNSIATASLVLGLGELFDKSPFRTS